jgi:hypothetical protein
MFERSFQAKSIPSLNRVFGVSVSLERGSVTTDQFTARRSDRKHMAIDADTGLVVAIEMRDFMFAVAAVVIGNETVEPRTGDRIIEGDEVFEIQPPDDKTKSVGLQRGGYEWIVHTKKIQ